MRILFISRRFYPDIKGGGQISALYIAKAVRMQGHDVYVCTFTDGEDSIEEIDGIKIYRKHIPKLGFSKVLSNMDYMYIQMAKISSKIIKRIKPDILHLLNFESIPLSSVYYKKKFNILIIATVNGPNFGCYTGSGVDYKGETCINCRTFKRYLCSVDRWGKVKGTVYYLYSLWYMNMLRFSYGYVDRFIPISNAMVSLMKNMAIPRQKMKVIPNPLGAELTVDKKLLKLLKKKYSGEKIIFYAGRITEDKGIQFTLQALKYLPETYIFVIAGWGAYKKSLYELSKKLGVAERVHFFGKIQFKEMGTYYTLADYFCHFPIFYEPFGRTLIEAMSQGTLTIARDFAGIKDIIKHRENGILVDSLDPKVIAKTILKISNKEYSKITKKAIKYVKEKYLLEKIGKQYVVAYVK